MWIKLILSLAAKGKPEEEDYDDCKNCRRKMQLRSTNTLLLLLLSIVFVGILSLSILYVTAGYTVYKYAIVIDAGSTHCQVNLYKWKADKLNNTGIIEQVTYCAFDEPISGRNFSLVAAQLAECLRNTTQAIKNEAPYANDTLVFLGATAGMRIMNMSEPVRTADIFGNLTKRIETSGYGRVGRVSIISGRDEGLFAWIAVNYIKRSFFPKRRFLREPKENTYGILDMGGASAQIAHQINESEMQPKSSEGNSDQIDVRLYGTNYTVSTFSNLCFGVDQAILRHLVYSLREHINNTPNQKNISMPCFAKGLTRPVDSRLFNNCTTFLPEHNFEWKVEYGSYQFVGTSDFDQCYEKINQKVLDLSECRKNFKYCFKESSHPKADDKFYAVSAYYYSTIMMRQELGEKISKKAFLNFSRKICTMDKQALADSTDLNFKFVKKYCFQQIYIYLTLQKVYHFDEKSWENIMIAKEIDNIDLGWALGYIIKETNGIPEEDPKRSFISTPVYIGIIVLLAMALFSVVALLLYRRYNRIYIGPNNNGEETTSLNMTNKV